MVIWLKKKHLDLFSLSQQVASHNHAVVMQLQLLQLLTKVRAALLCCNCLMKHLHLS